MTEIKEEDYGVFLDVTANNWESDKRLLSDIGHVLENLKYDVEHGEKYHELLKGGHLSHLSFLIASLKNLIDLHEDNHQAVRKIANFLENQPKKGNDQ